MTRSHRDRIEALLRVEPVVSDLQLLQTIPPVLAGVRELLAGLADDLAETSGPVFGFPSARLASPIKTEVVTATAALATAPELAWVHGAGDLARPLVVARSNAGLVVSVCHSARSTRTAGEAGVETAAAYRGRGLATAVTARWADEVRAQRRVPLYSTAWTNLASRGVARRLGLVMIGEDYTIG